MTDVDTPPFRQELCRSFRAVASRIHGDIGRDRTVGLVPWETSITDYLLLTLVTRHPREILARRFDQREEAAIGADWEWWFRDATGFAGMRVQAKRRDPIRGAYGLKQRVASGEKLQAEVFHQRAAERGLTALYCLYGDIDPDDPPRPDMIAPCVHTQDNELDLSQWGCSLLSARAAIGHAHAPRTRHAMVLQDAHPLFHLVCDEPRSAALPASRSLTKTVQLELGVLVAAYYQRPRPGDFWQVEEEIAEARQSGIDPPSNIRRAFEERDVALVEPDSTMAGVVLVNGLA